MDNLIKINNKDLQIKEFQNQRAEDKKLIEGYIAIVKEMAIKYKVA